MSYAAGIFEISYSQWDYQMVNISRILKLLTWHGFDEFGWWPYCYCSCFLFLFLHCYAKMQFFIHCNFFCQKYKFTYLLLIGWAWSNMGVSFFKSQDSIICCISKMNEWIELISCMPIRDVRKAKSYFRYTWSNMVVTF